MSTNNILEEIRKNISLFQKETEKEETGKVIEVGDGIDSLSWLSK